MVARIGLVGVFCCVIPAAPADEVFFDDFNDGYLDPCNWIPTSGEGVTITEADGVLTLTSELGGHTQVSTVYAFQGDFDAQVDFDLLQFPPIYGSNASLRVQSTAPGLNLVAIKRWREASTNTYAFLRYVDGSYQHLATVETTDMSGKFRIKRLGNDFTAYWWSGAWQQIGGTHHFAGPARLILDTFGGGNDPTVSAAYDNSSVVADGMTRDGDFDFDGDVDLADFADFGACMSGPEVPADPACSLGDFDCDGDVDLGDFALFQQQFTGPK